jgi:squalene synthase HpnC
MGQMPTASHPAADEPATVDPVPTGNPATSTSSPHNTGAAATPLPSTVEMAFAPITNTESAQSYTWHLANSHYENFSVASVLLPRRLRQDFCNVYAFCRIADDLGDEIGDREQSLRLLDRFRQETQAMYAGNPRTIVFAALAETVKRYDIPIQPFLDLIDAFEQDQRVDRYDTFEQVCDYCRRSADPVGRLVLYMCGYRDDRRQRLSDRTCSALQLANFWQDVRRDILDRDRIYLPRETMAKFAVTEQQLRDGRCDDNYRKCIQFEVDRTSAMFDEGDALLPLLDDAVRPQVSLFGQGGRAILDAIRRQNYDTLTSRPSLSSWQKGRLIFGAVAARVKQVGQDLLQQQVEASA